MMVLLDLKDLAAVHSSMCSGCLNTCLICMAAIISRESSHRNALQAQGITGGWNRKCREWRGGDNWYRIRGDQELKPENAVTQGRLAMDDEPVAWIESLSQESRPGPLSVWWRPEPACVVEDCWACFWYSNDLLGLVNGQGVKEDLLDVSPCRALREY